MNELELDGHLGRKVSIDVCHECQAFWFDKYESLQLAPSSVLKLFKLIGDSGGVKTAPTGSAACPRCGRMLGLVHDQQRSTRFEYRGCPERHGRLISFFNFLREKDFVRPLLPAQVAELQARVESVKCSNCGAPVDLAKGTACAHCGSPLSMLDLQQAEALMQKLHEEGHARPVEPALALDLEQARRDVNRSFDSFDRDPEFYGKAKDEGLVGAGLAAFMKWMRR